MIKKRENRCSVEEIVNIVAEIADKDKLKYDKKALQALWSAVLFCRILEVFA